MSTTGSHYAIMAPQTPQVLVFGSVLSSNCFVCVVFMYKEGHCLGFESCAERIVVYVLKICKQPEKVWDSCIIDVQP